jgi:hypothetical protein
MLCRTELLYWAEIPRAGGDLRTVLPEASADLDLDERDPWAHMTARRGALADAPPRRGRALDPPRAELNPNFALAHALLGMPLAIQRAREEAAASAQHALRLSRSDPLVSAYALYAMVGAHFAAGHYADGAPARRTVEISPEAMAIHYFLIAAAATQGDRAAAGGGADQPAAPGAGFLAEVVEREHGVSRRGGRAPPRGSPQGGTALGSRQDPPTRCNPRRRCCVLFAADRNAE